MRRLAGVFVCILAIGLSLTACAGKGTLSSEVVEETGAYRVIADDAAKDAAVGSLGGGILIEENQVLLVSPDLTKGSLQLTLADANSEVVFDEVLSGRVLSTYEIEPGDYSIGVTCLENGTTGSILVIGQDKDELIEQDEALEDALEGVQTEGASD